jgi:Arc/MetJ-type ribon-helix-helix transcriptional regulator
MDRQARLERKEKAAIEGKAAMADAKARSEYVRANMVKLREQRLAQQHQQSAAQQHSTPQSLPQKAPARTTRQTGPKASLPRTARKSLVK